VQGKILGGDNILTLNTTFSRVMRASTGDSVSSAPTIEQSVMIFGHDRGRGGGRQFGGRSMYGGKLGSLDKGPLQFRHCGMSNHISEKS